MPNSQKLSVKKLYFKDTSFASLMKHRIYNVLLISNNYNAFILEEDGRIEEQMFNEYYALNLRYPPRFTIVDTKEEALEQLERQNYELIFVMSDNAGGDIIDISKIMKQHYPDIPLVVLAPFLRDISVRMEAEQLQFIDYIFCWLGNVDLLLAIIKLIEDKMNVEEDIDSVGVQVVLLVEDSVQFTSFMLPYIYKFIFMQSRSFMTEALNEHQQMLRMRGRPKILLARSYEEARDIYEKYNQNVLGVISDVDFPREGKLDKNAGFALYHYIKKQYPYMAYIFNSADTRNKARADELKVAFLDKTNPLIVDQFKEQLLMHFGFGDFLFRDPATWEIIDRASSLRDLQKIIYTLPDDSLAYHVSRNHISHWLYSRALFPLASYLESLSVTDFENLGQLRDAIMGAIVQYRKIKNRGVVAEFREDRFDKYSNFARIGAGSMGGKGRGLAFLDTILKNNSELDEFDEENVVISIPKTVVLCTDIFDEFMQTNDMYALALSDAPDQQILDAFLAARLPEKLHTSFCAFLDAVASPVAIRSSSLLEDSYYQPFAGVYSTYMIPYDTDHDRMIGMLESAIKAVFASVFYSESKAYMASTGNVIESEKMAIIIQEVVGRPYEDKRFYPDFSGVLRSINFYPLRPEKAGDGICNIALGLGKYVVDGNMSLRFSPVYPKKALQTSQLEMTLRQTQTFFYAVEMEAPNQNFLPALDDVENLLKCDLATAEADGTLRYIASTYDRNDGMIRDGIYEEGRRLITFSNILKHDAFPLARILRVLMDAGQKAMGHPVEIEFAVTMGASPGEASHFGLLQIRPIMTYKDNVTDESLQVPDEDVLIRSSRSLGYGTINDIRDIVYVKPEGFNPADNVKTAEEIGELNQKLLAANRNYLLIGPGRWGSGDPWLGIPVRWAQISAARVIVESGLDKYRIDPSQGTHFFHNITSLQVAYLTIDPYADDGEYDIERLGGMKAGYESAALRHVRLKKPLVVKINGKSGKSVVFFEK